MCLYVYLCLFVCVRDKQRQKRETETENACLHHSFHTEVRGQLLQVDFMPSTLVPWVKLIYEVYTKKIVLSESSLGFYMQRIGGQN